ncbi:autotransporter domain-containing protein [Candidatus Tisiphia endosymbiont of Xenochironomus xenolabis]|uniref:autotransporter domain-containing protein n=1 Tax=Candidatus Tisiphia endosymbiont of Xenochironomus xenolabis TaxID=3139334 RepID=UPI0035C88D6B
MAKKQKFLKNLLTSVSVASVIASMGWNNVAFGKVTHGFRMLSKKDITLSDTADKKNWKKVQKDGNPVGDYTAAPGDNTAFLYSGPVTLDANVHDRIITAINLVGNKPGMLTVNENLSIGSIVRGEKAQKDNIQNVLPITIAAGKTLTLTGTKAIDIKHGFTTRENTYTALGNIILNGADSTLVIRPANDDAGNPGNISLTGNITTNIDREGILTFEGYATVNGEIGANNALAEVNFNEVGNIHLRAVAKAETFKFGAEAIVNAHTNIIGNVDFNGNNAATINLAVGQKIDGAVDNTGAANNGILDFAGIGTVTGNIGKNNALFLININDGDVDLQQDVSTETLHFAVANRTVKIGGNFTGEVYFANAGTLTFYGADPHSFNATIANGDNGILNVQTDLIATHEDIGNIKTINIGIPGEVGFPVVDPVAKVLAINASVNNINLLTPADAEVNFLHPESRLELFTIRQERIITFENNLPGHAAVGGGGIVFMSGINDATLTVQANGNKSLGTVARKLGHIAAFGKVTIKGDNANKVDISNTGKLSIVHDTKFVTEFIDESGTSAAIARIDIGQSSAGAGGVGTAVTGPAIYVLDAKHGDFHILTDATHRINFLDPDAKLILRNSDNDDKTITLANNLVPINDKEGVVEFNSPVVNTMLTINKVGDASLGTANLKLKEIIFSGAGDLNITPTIYAHTIISDITGTVTTNGIHGDVLLSAASQLTGAVNGSVGFAATSQLIGNVTTDVLFNANGKLVGNVGGNVVFASAGTTTGTVAGHVVIRDGGDGTVGGLISNNVTFNGDGQLTANGSIQGDVYFDHKKGTVTLADKQKIGGIIKDGENATLEFLGDGEVGGAIDGLKLLTAGNGNVTLAASGNHSVTEIQGNGVQKLTLASGFNLAGGINLTGGQAVGLIFEGNSRISGVVGTEKNPVGNIQIKAGTVRFDDLINAKNIRILGGTTVEITKDVNAENINGLGIVKFNNKKDIVINSQIGANIIEIAGSNVETIQTFSAVNVHFSSSQNATLTLKEDSIISNITTAGNGLHSLALNANLTIVGDVGSDSNRLKEIKLLGDHTLSITNSNLYAAVLTTTSDSSKVIFESSGSVAYGNLGSDKFRLSDVTFDSDSTVKADIYSKKITIKDNKTATFAGTEERAILISGIPRLLKDFTYSTEIVSEEINVETASSKMKFGNATLVKAPIKDGQVILADNVWFKEEVMSTTPVTFVPGKYVILEKNIAFSSIEASQAKLIILAEKQTITGDLTAKDLTIDLGTSQLKYAGNAKLVGELKLHSFYDSSKSAGGNIEIQSNGKLDLSQLDKLLVTIAGRTDVNKISDDTKYILISSVYGNGISTLDPSKITLDSTSEQNRFVSWTINPNNLTLYAKDISKEVLEKEFADKPKEKKQFIKQLDKAAEADINCDAAKFRNDLGCMDKNNAQLAMEKLLSSNENLTSMKDGLESLKYVISEVIFQVTHQITLRSENMQVPVASGDDDNVILYGIWGSPFYSIADQKMRKGVSGYKSKSAGGIVGFDSLINDNLLIGTAYSQINTKMFHKDQKIGDKTSGNTNVFSIYGLYKFSANWFAEAIASYGITNVKNLEGRVLPTDKRTVTTLGIAVAKYKSTSYSGQLLTGYSYQLSEKLTITPIIGLRYSQFIDAGHVETGTACQNLIVKNRLYNKFEGILGLRTATNIQLDQLLLIPELHGYINYEFKGKSPIIEARLGGMNEPLQTKSVKSAKIFFTVGTSLAAKHNMMEYSVAYNANIANKYIGHQGSLKVKVNF